MILAVACGKKEEKKEISLDTIVEQVKEAYGEDYLPDSELDQEAIENLYGLSKEMYDDVYAEIPMISVNNDTFIAVKCKDGKQEEVVKTLRNYQDYLINDSMQYPSNMVKVKASRIIEKEGYAFFVMLGSIPMDVEEQGEDAILKRAEENNDIAEKVINGIFQ